MTVTHARGSTPDAEPPLRATLTVEPGPEFNCPVVAESTDATSVTQSFAGGNGCHSEVTVVDDGRCRRSYVTKSSGTDCPCRIISGHDCVFDVERVSNGSLVISVVVEDRRELSRIVSSLKDAGAGVRLKRLVRRSDADRASVELDATEITEKQREAVELAVERGYYDRPRETDLDALAEALGITKSAVSQRLAAVESTLLTSLADRGPDESRE